MKVSLFVQGCCVFSSKSDEISLSNIYRKKKGSLGQPTEDMESTRITYGMCLQSNSISTEPRLE